MEKILRVHNVNDYARYIGAPELHPLISVIHYDELTHCRHSLNNYDVYGIFIGDETLENLTYGLTTYDLLRHALMCVSPGQIGGKADTGDEIHTKGWALLFDPELIRGTDLERMLCMLAGDASSYSELPPNENCSFEGSWAENDRDLSHIMTVYADVSDGSLTIGAKSNGFFKIDDFQLTYLGDKPTTIIDTPVSNSHDKEIYDLAGRRVSQLRHGLYIIDGKKIVY